MKIDTVIFDYDGVIVDSFPSLHKIYLEICDKLGKSCPEDIEEFRQFYLSAENFRDFYSKLGILSDEENLAENIYREGLIKYESPFFDEIVEVLNTLKNDGYRLVLLSANYKKEIVNKLTNENLLEHFVKIEGNEEHLGVLKKEDKIKRILSELGSETAIMIGDMNTDYESSRKAGIHPILVEYGWGYNPEKVLDYNLSIKVNRPNDLLSAIEEVEKFLS